MSLIQNSISYPIGFQSFVDQDVDPLSFFCEELSLHVFSFLNANELVRICRVSKLWRKLASDEALWNALYSRKFSSSVREFGEKEWKTYVDLALYELRVEDAPPH